MITLFDRPILEAKHLLLIFCWLTCSTRASELPPPATNGSEKLSTQSLKKQKSICSQGLYAMGFKLGQAYHTQLKAYEKIGLPISFAAFKQGFQKGIEGTKLSKPVDSNEVLKQFAKLLNEMQQLHYEAAAAKQQQLGKVLCEQFMKRKSVMKTASGLLYSIDKQGTGAFPAEQSVITIHYRALLADGKELDNTYTNKKSITLPLKQMMPGCQEGLRFLREGGKMTLVLPPHLAFGDANGTEIPPQATVLLDIELLKVESKSSQSETVRHASDIPALKKQL